MFNRRLSPWIQSAVMVAALSFAASYAVSQEQKLPDAPTPQNNAPAPSVNLPSQGAPDDQGLVFEWKPRSAAKYSQRLPAARRSRPTRKLRLRVQQGIKTVPAGSASNAGESGRDELFRLQRTVSFVTVPVTVKDDEGKLVDGLLQSDFSIYEDGIKQQIKLFTSDPFPLSAALIIDQGMSDLTLKKVNQTFSALGGSFGPFDEVAVFTYGNTVNQRSDFGNATRMEIALQRIKDERGARAQRTAGGWTFWVGPSNQQQAHAGR